MTPVTIKIDKRYRGVGRIAVRSGTTERAVFNEILVSLDWLAARGDVEILRMVQSGELHPLEVREAFRAGDLRRLPRPGDLKRLKPAITKWLSRARLADRSRKAYEWHLNRMIGKLDPRVSDLPRLLERFRGRCQKAGHHRMFNHTRSAALSFLRHTYKTGRHSPLWIEVAGIDRLKIEHTEKPQYTPDFCREIATALKRNGAMFWAMCITGMNPSEYWGRWAVADDRIRIYGTKRAARWRVVPLLWVPVKPHITIEGFKTAIGKLRDRGVSSKSGRDAYAQWMEAAGIPRTRRKMYLGHGATDVQDLYERHELDAYLAADAERMRGHIGEPYLQMGVVK